MTAIIFGSSGQDGIYLSRLLEERGARVIGIDRKSGLNLSDPDAVAFLIKNSAPDFVFHLAAHSTTRHDAWKENHETICTGSLNILEAVRLHSPSAKVFLSGSGLQFVNNGEPIHEKDTFHAGSPYAVSRIHSAYAARYYRSLGVKAYVGYFFNHDSPFRTEKHINRKIIETIKRIAAGSAERLEIGDLSVRKEFGFAGDIVKGIMALVEQDEHFEAVIGTGQAHSIGEWVEICFSLYDLNWKDHVDKLPGFRPEYQVLVSNPATLFSLGWRPETDIQSLAKMMCGRP